MSAQTDEKSVWIIPLIGLRCRRCADRLTRHLEGITGISFPAVSLIDESLKVHLSDVTHLSAVIQGIEEIEVDPKVTRVDIPTVGAARSALVLEAVVGTLSGVRRALADPITSRLAVDYVPGAVGVGEIRDVLQRTGYEVGHPVHRMSRSVIPPIKGSLLVFGTALLLACVVVAAAAPLLTENFRLEAGSLQLRSTTWNQPIRELLPQLYALPQLQIQRLFVISAVLSLLILGGSYVFRAWSPARRRTLDADGLTAMAILAMTAGLLISLSGSSPIFSSVEAVCALALLRLREVRLQGIRRYALRSASTGGSPVPPDRSRMQGLTTSTRWMPYLLLFLATGAGVGRWFLFNSLDLALFSFAAVLICTSPTVPLLTRTALFRIARDRARAMGIHFAGDSALEELSSLRVLEMRRRGVMLDVTPHVSHLFLLEGSSANELARQVATVASHSDHAVAHALASYAGAEQPGGAQQVIRAAGLMEGTVDGRRISFGQPAAMRKHGVDVSPAVEEIQRFAKEGKTVTLVACDGRLSGGFVLEETIRPDARVAIKHLDRLGIKSIVRSAAEPEAIQAGSSAVGIAHVESSDIRPATEKRVSVSFGRAGNAPQRLAIVLARTGDEPGSADVTITDGTLSHVVSAIEVARRVRRRAQRNFAIWMVMTLLASVAGSGLSAMLWGERPYLLSAAVIGTLATLLPTIRVAVPQLKEIG